MSLKLQRSMNIIIIYYSCSDYENRIIDDALEVSGISMKPTDGQLAEFIKRIRTLNKNVIWMLMNNRLTKYTAEDNEINIKSLTVSKITITNDRIYYMSSKKYSKRM